MSKGVGLELVIVKCVTHHEIIIGVIQFCLGNHGRRNINAYYIKRVIRGSSHFTYMMPGSTSYIQYHTFGRRCCFIFYLTYFVVIFDIIEDQVVIYFGIKVIVNFGALFKQKTVVLFISLSSGGGGEFDRICDSNNNKKHRNQGQHFSNGR